MAFEEIKSKGGMDMVMDGERGLVAGRSQREKRRSYKDLLREEEEIAAQVRKSSKKRPKVSRLSTPRWPSSPQEEAQICRPLPHVLPLLLPPHRHSDGPPAGHHLPSGHRFRTSPHLHKKPSYPPFSSHSSKDRKRESSSGGGGGSKGSHSFSHNRPPSSSSSSSKKHSSSSSKSSLFHGGAPKEEPLTLREADGLKMKLIMSRRKRKERRSHSRLLTRLKEAGRRRRTETGRSTRRRPRRKSSRAEIHCLWWGKRSRWRVITEEAWRRQLFLGGELEAGELPKKKNTTAYQVFCKEYRVNINAEQPGLVFGELSKKLAEVWKQKAQYLQHRQNKAEATTIPQLNGCPRNVLVKYNT
ncbi:hypothetical protein F7725_003948 [Dissostichus mawsoni]|uniref:HMG box domain-containing protein n=1 Tax=Dissostichus mawsoni TaxID=36200 RepID=A0A7J5YBQ9_DISMA|nr:hypothetical protein F7725_003948 [Dissostichus mawsoni]